MARKIFKRLTPKPDTIKDHRMLKMFGTLIHDPQLFHLTRHSVSTAFAIGLFWTCIPIPVQMFLAAGMAIIFRANIIISVGLVWITNPLTIPFIFGFFYLIGTWLLNIPVVPINIELTWQWLETVFLTIWQPLLLGSVVAAVISSVIGYFGIRLFWRIHAVSRWKERQQKRRLKKCHLKNRV